MSRSVSLMVAISTAFLITLSGCNSNKRQWEITVENKSDVPSSFFITMGNGTAKIENMAKGKTHSLIVGDNKTVVESVRVVRGKDEQTLIPKVELPVGKRYAIAVGPDGKVDASISDR